MNMKKILKLTGLTALWIFIMCSTAFAYYERIKEIPSVKINVVTSSLELGDELPQDASSCVSIPQNDYCYLEDAVWIDDIYSLKVGAEPRMKVYIAATPKEVSTDKYSTLYLFRNNYSSSNVRINGGSYISSARRDNGYTLEVALRVKPVSGSYETPYNAYWASSKGTGRWETGENSSGYFDVICYRGSSIVKKLKNYKGNSYNFFPYMTKEGDYTFKVRSVAPEGISSSVGKNSEWCESDTIYIGADDVSDGSGQTSSDENGSIQPNGNNYPNGTGNLNVAGWVHNNGIYYFRYPNGEYVRDGWLKLDDKYYMFDTEGRMVTGWAQNKYKIWYYMDKKTGAMKTGWLQDGNYWYFLNTTKDIYEGCMVIGWWTHNGKKYYFNNSGIMVTGWYQIDGKWYYFYPEGSTNGAYGYLATNTKIGPFKVDASGVWVN